MPSRGGPRPPKRIVTHQLDGVLPRDRLFRQAPALHKMCLTWEHKPCRSELTVNMRTIARLKRQLKKAGIRHQDVAARAIVDRTMVVKVLSGKAKSARVLTVAQEMLTERSSSTETAA